MNPVTITLWATIGLVGLVVLAFVFHVGGAF